MEFDRGDQALVGDVESYGWHVIQIAESGLSPGWVFSVGMWHTLGSPEIAVLGLDKADAAHAINKVGAAVQGGVALNPDVVLRTVLQDGWPMAFRPVDDGWYRPLFGYAVWFGQIGPMPIVQGVWADPNGHFPWDAAFDRAYTADQPKLWIPPAEHPPGRWSGELSRPQWSFPISHHVASITTRGVLAGAPILMVSHDEDGDWQFLDHGDPSEGDAAVTEIGHLVSRDPGLMEVSDLPQGWVAWRTAPGAPWRREARS